MSKNNKIVHTDYLVYVKTLSDSIIDLAIIDPPYNVGAAKWDKVDNYFEWLQEVMIETCRVLKSSGSLYLWGTTKNNDFLRIKLWIDEHIDLYFKNWIVWIHEVKQHKKLEDKYLCKHEDLLFYTGENNTFNIVRDDPPAFQLKMHRGRYDEEFFIERYKLPPSQQKIFKNGLQLGSPAKSWWKGPSNQSNAKRIKKFMGYKSEWVCERIIKVSSNKNDLILIPFAGTGSECVAAAKLNRNFIATEKVKELYDISTKRLEQTYIDF